MRLAEGRGADPQVQTSGYDGIIVTDHFNRTTFDYLKIDLHDPRVDKVAAFLSGYNHMTAAAEGTGIRIYRGAELRFDESDNDYLLYGYTDELLADPEAIFKMGIAAFAPIARGQGALIIQAHPYRAKCTPAASPTCYLDGVEGRQRQRGAIPTSTPGPRNMRSSSA